MDWQWFAAHKETIGVVFGGGLIAFLIGLIQYLASQRVSIAQDRAELAEKSTESAEKRAEAAEKRAERAEDRTEALEARSETDLASRQAAERREAETRSLAESLQKQFADLAQARQQDEERHAEDVAGLRAGLDTMQDGVVTQEELRVLREQMDRLAAQPSAAAAPLRQVEDTASGFNRALRAAAKESAGWTAINQGTPEALHEAIEHFRQALEIRPRSADAYWGWGNALGYLGRLADDPDAAHDYYQQACEKYEQALEIKPDYHEALNNWGNACGGLAHLSEGEERERWLAEAERLATEAEAIEPGAGIYNLACAHALQLREDEAFAELHAALEGGRPSWSHVAKDPDWDHLREHPEYKKLEAEFGGVSED